MAQIFVYARCFPHARALAFQKRHHKRRKPKYMLSAVERRLRRRRRRQNKRRIMAAALSTSHRRSSLPPLPTNVAAAISVNAAVAPPTKCDEPVDFLRRLNSISSPAHRSSARRRVRFCSGYKPPPPPVASLIRASARARARTMVLAVLPGFVRSTCASSPRLRV